MASLLPQIYLDVGNGITPSDGAKLTFKVVGSDTLKNTYTDAGAGTPHANPVIADSLGVFAQIFITGDYDWVLTDKNNVQQDNGTVSELQTTAGAAVTKNFATLALAVADTGLVDGDALNIAERTTGNGGGAMWDVVLSSTVTENTFNIIQGTGVATLSLVIRVDKSVSARSFGAVGDDTADDTGAFTAISTYVNANSKGIYIEAGTYRMDGNALRVTECPFIIFEDVFFERRSYGIKDDYMIRIQPPCAFYGSVDIDGNKDDFTVGPTDRDRDGLVIRDGNNFVNYGTIISHDNVGHGIQMAQTHYNQLGVVTGYNNGVNVTPFNNDAVAWTSVTNTNIRSLFGYNNTRYAFSVTGGQTNSFNNSIDHIVTHSNVDAGVDIEVTGSMIIKNGHMGDAVNGYETILCTNSENMTVEDTVCSLISGGAVGKNANNVTLRNIDLHPPTGNSNLAIFGDGGVYENIRIHNSGATPFSSKTVDIQCQDGKAVLNNVWCDNSNIYEVVGARHVSGCGADTFEAGSVYQINGESIANATGVKMIEVRNGITTTLQPPVYTPITFADLDTSPSVIGGSSFETFTNAITINDFDNGTAGQRITVVSRSTVVYDTTGSNLTGSSADISTAAGDVTEWYTADGTTWIMTSFIDVSANNN